ncbi:hypothetical protein V6N11_037472 [Hibiscus sabdariffa]|uniref:Uncharacterized protein n=1 Tax=Hibiscus sabdariffa TaxID=183260 RepID=A0ABR2P1G7_9ROSI
MMVLKTVDQNGRLRWGSSESESRSVGSREHPHVMKRGPTWPLLGDWRGAGQLLFGGANVYVRRDTVSSKLQPHQNTTHEFESKQKAMDKVEVSRLKFGTTIANAIFLYFPY